MTDNPFANEEAWDVSTGTILGSGDHLCTIKEIDGTTTSSGGYPQIELQSANDNGEIKDWIVVTPKSIGRVVQLTDAAGIDRPNDDQVTPEGSGFRLAPEYLKQLVGKQVGVIVREEPNRNEPGKTRTVVKGYVTPDKINASDVPADTSGFAAAVPGTVADDDIPF